MGTMPPKEKSKFGNWIDKINRNRYVVLAITLMTVISFVIDLWPRGLQSSAHDGSEYQQSPAKESIDDLESYNKENPGPKTRLTGFTMWDDETEVLRYGKSNPTDQTSVIWDDGEKRICVSYYEVSNAQDEALHSGDLVLSELERFIGETNRDAKQSEVIPVVNPMKVFALILIWGALLILIIGGVILKKNILILVVCFILFFLALCFLCFPLHFPLNRV